MSPQDSSLPAKDMGDDFGIEGITIVIHLRGKDDLVISTDLTRNALAL